MVRLPTKAGRTKSVVYKDREIAGAAVGSLIRLVKPEKMLSAEFFSDSSGLCCTAKVYYPKIVALCSRNTFFIENS